MSSPTSDNNSKHPQLFLREIPGDYGLPFIGSIKDRLDYFYNQGEIEFFRSRATKYTSTVFRANMPPGPFIASNSKVIVLLDANSFPVLFDTTKVEKKNILDGTFMPSTSFFGGYRPCAFLDPSEPKHAKLKQLFLSLLASLHDKFIPTFQTSLNELFNNIDTQISTNFTADFNVLSDNMSYDFVFRLFFNINPTDTKLGSDGQSTITNWLALQLAPIATLGLAMLPNCLEDFMLHTFKLPFFPVKFGYKKLYKVIYESSTSIFEEAEKLGLIRAEVCHNLIFLASFNAFGGMKRLFPSLIKWIGLAGPELHKQLADEIRAVVSSEGGSLTFAGLEKMTLTKSVVYEAIRMEPPVPYQYAKAKEDLTVQSHESTFEIKKGEMMFGYQPLATRDGMVFGENSNDFVADRFVGEKGEKLLQYVFWSNDRETVNPTVENKQCPAKDLVVLLSRLMVTEFFLRYHTFTVETGTSFSGSTVTITSLTKTASVS